jgi:hypothetical protein
MRLFDKLLFVAGALLICTFFLWMAGAGLSGYFSLDDLSNLGAAAATPAWRLVLGNAPFSGEYRPMGALWYRVIYEMAGFNPFPFHATALAFLIANLFLTYSVARRISSSREVGALTALLMTYHANCAHLYYDTGTIYEVLAYFFYFSTFLFYLRIRQQQRWCNAAEFVLLCLLYVCAINSKESGLTLPLSLAAYELIYHRPQSWGMSEWRSWLAKEGRGALICGAIGAVYLVSRFVGPNALARNPLYIPEFTVARLIETNRSFLAQLFYRIPSWLFHRIPPWVSQSKVLLLYGLLLGFALVSRARTLWLGLSLAIFAALPVDFMGMHPMSAYYIPLFGWALYGATVAAGVTSWILRRIPHAGGHWPLRAKGVAVFVVFALALTLVNRHKAPFAARMIMRAGFRCQAQLQQFRRVRPEMKRGARMFFLVNLESTWLGFYNCTVLLRLANNDPSLQVDDCEMGPRQSKVKLAAYDYLLDYKDGQFVEVTPAEVYLRLSESHRECLSDAP